MSKNFEYESVESDEKMIRIKGKGKVELKCFNLLSLSQKVGTCFDDAWNLRLPILSFPCAIL